MKTPFIEAIKTVQGTLICESGTFSFEQFYQDIQVCSAQSQLTALPQPTCVALVSDYSYAALVTLFALYQNRHTIVPLVPDRPEVIAGKLKTAGCQYIITLENEGLQVSAHTAPYPTKIIDKLEEAAGLILFSSGTTGEPKGLLYNLDLFLARYTRPPSQSTHPLRTALILAFDHMGGLDTLFSLIAKGAYIVLIPSKNPSELCKLIQDHQLTFISVSPSFLALILASGADKTYDLASLKSINYGAEPMPEPLLQRLTIGLPHVKFKQTLGTSETGTIPIQSVSNTSTRFSTTTPHFKVENGELWIKSNVGFIGYLNAPNSLSEDGWFKTGDLVETFEDGSFRITGRHQEIINVGGNKVLPTEVESLILELPEVLDARVYGSQSSLLGQVVCVDVILRGELSVSQIKSRIRGHILAKAEAFKVPTKVTIVEAHAVGNRFKKKRLP